MFPVELGHGWMDGCAKEADKGLLRAKTAGHERFDLPFCCLKGAKMMHTQLNTCSLPVLTSNSGKQYSLMWVTYYPGLES